MELTTVWFVLIAIFWTGYLVLEGFDFGVGMLIPIIGRDDAERRVVINTIGPVWDGNEVWLLTAGGATFAAFPEWYATLFSGFYLPLLLILVALIVRAVAFEYRGKINSPAWRARWDAGIGLGSWLPSILWGVAFANIVRGVAINADAQYTGGFWALLNPYALLGGLTTLLLFLTHGAVFLALKTDGTVRARAGALAAKLSIATLVVAGGFAVWTQVAYSVTWTWAVVAVAALALLAAVVLIFGSLYPDVMPSTTDPAFSLTITNASSTHYTLTVMTWVAVVLTPVVLAYQAWTYWVFRKRISTADIPAHAGLTFERSRERA